MSKINELKKKIFSYSIKFNSIDDLDKKIDIDSLHVIGKSDKLVPYENALELTNYFVNSQTYLHELGHFIPNNTESKNVYCEFLKKMINKYK